MGIRIPDNITAALNALNRSGFEAYAVGGCVRDSLLGRQPNDWDICTSALPEQTEKCFADYKTIPTGIRHGTVTVIIDSPIEITTFRIDGDYADNRHPRSVSFTPSLAEDLKRRDFTINAMALGTQGEVVDLFGGKKDLESRLIRCVGSAQKRFEEDALRILRALRFAATLDFEIEGETAAAIHEKKELLRNISAERIKAETDKLLCGKCEKLLRDFSDVFAVFMPEAALPKSAAAVAAAVGGLPVKLSLLLKNCSAEQAESTLRRLKYDKATIRTVSIILKHKSWELTDEKPFIRRLLNSAGTQAAPLIAEYHFSAGAITAELKRNILKTAEKVVSGGECFTISSLAVNGSDISELKICPDSKVGAVLHALLEAVMDNLVENKKAALIQYAVSQLKY